MSHKKGQDTKLFYKEKLVKVVLTHINKAMGGTSEKSLLHGF